MPEDIRFFLNKLKNISTASKIIISLLLCGCKTSPGDVLETAALPARVVSDHQRSSAGEGLPPVAGSVEQGSWRSAPGRCARPVPKVYMSSQIPVFGLRVMAENARHLC